MVNAQKGVKGFVSIPLADRFWAKVKRAGPDECWMWTAHINQDGYGELRTSMRRPKGQMEKAHRVAYELLIGPIPEGLELDHLCKHPACVNPAHLEAVPHRVNVLRGNGKAAIHAARTHCIRGHPFDLFNTIFWHHRRYCRTCKVTRDALRAKGGINGEPR